MAASVKLLIPTSLAFLTSIFIFGYILSTSRIVLHLDDHESYRHHVYVKPWPRASATPEPTKQIIQIHLPVPPKKSVTEYHHQHSSNISREAAADGDDETRDSTPLSKRIEIGSGGGAGDEATAESDDMSQLPSKGVPSGSGTENSVKDDDTNDEEDVFHDRDIFLENYKEMNRSLKIYVYPHQKNDPFASVLLPVSYEPSGNYASESYFKKALFKSHFITKDPSQADFFFLPFSIAGMRHDKRIGVGRMKDFVRKYMSDVKQKYPYWNRTGGADHFYVACHSIGKMAMENADDVKANAIQVVCSANNFLTGYFSHKDVSLPQIWPRQGILPPVEPSKRNRLAFFAGANNSPVRQELVRVWGKDPKIFAHSGRLTTPYSTELLKSKFCLHAKGFEVNTARIGDALYYGCVPVILADHYDLPFADTLNWKSFSVVVATADIPLLRKILEEITTSDEYLRLLRNVLEVRTHFQWHSKPVEYDAFYMVMYELWLRRSFVAYTNLQITS